MSSLPTRPQRQLLVLTVTRKALWAETLVLAACVRKFVSSHPCTLMWEIDRLITDLAHKFWEEDPLDNIGIHRKYRLYIRPIFNGGYKKFCIKSLIRDLFYRKHEFPVSAFAIWYKNLWKHLSLKLEEISGFILHFFS